MMRKVALTFLMGSLCLLQITAQLNLDVFGDGYISNKLEIGKPFSGFNDILTLNSQTSNPGLTFRKRETFFGSTSNSYGRIWMDGNALNLGNTTTGVGPRLSLYNMSMTHWSDNVHFRGHGVSNTAVNFFTPWGVTFSHSNTNFNSINDERPWLKQGRTTPTGDFLYIGSTGDRSNTLQHAIMIGQNGMKVGRGHNGGTDLSKEYLLISEYETAGRLQMFKSNGTKTVDILANEGSGQGSQLTLYDNAGNVAIELDADYLGMGRMRTDELEIRGGADFSEQFDVTSKSIYMVPIPGQVVSIDPASPGKLIVASESYDKKVAGVISGANGIRPGMIMGQTGSIADGNYPIALNGRVFVRTNTQQGEIKPGDLLTTSDVKGEAMKVLNYAKAQGAIIGKAMTAIDKEGFVLVLINLQ